MRNPVFFSRPPCPPAALPPAGPAPRPARRGGPRTWQALGLLLALWLPQAAQAQTAPAWAAALAPTQVTGTGTAVTRGTAVNAAGDVFLTGFINGQVSFGATTLVSAGNDDVFVAKWNTAANTWAWATAGGGTSNDRGFGIAVSGTGVYLTGIIAPPATFGSTTLNPSGTAAFAARLVDAVPALTSLTPTSGPVGTPVTISGTNLGSATGVSFNGTAATLGPNTATTLTVNVPVGATTGNVTVTTADGTSNGLAFTVTVPPTITGLSPTRNLRNAARGSSVAVTFDQPMSGAAATAGAVKVFSQQRGGQMSGTQSGTATVSGNTVTFDPTTDFRPGETVFTTITAAAQGSGGANLAKGHVYQFTAAAGVGPGTFGGGQELGVGTAPVNLAVGDVNGDGHLDILALRTGGVSVRLNNGSGTFSGSQEVAIANSSFGIALGDVEGDGDLDLFVTTFSTTVQLRRNDGNGNFSGTESIATGSRPYGVALGDVNGDGTLDMVSVNNSSNSISIRFNNGSGVFSGTQNVAVGSQPWTVTLGDVDNDGDLDAVSGSAASGANTVSVRLNGGDATGSNTGVFGGTQQVTVGVSPITTALGDVDGDGDLDLVTANYGFPGPGSMSVRLNGGDATGSASGIFSGGSDLSVNVVPNGIVLGDIDGDGDLDLMTTHRITPSSGISVRLNNGSGTFSGSYSVAVGNRPYQLAAGDFDGDGDLDVATANQGNNSGTTVSVRFNQPLNQAPTGVGLSPQSVAENTAGGTAIGTFSTTDPDAGNTHTYSLVSGAGSTDNGAFSISGNQLVITASPDYETQSSYAIRVRATDQGSLFNEQAFTISVTDVVENLTISTTQTIPAGTWGTITVTPTGIATLSGPLTVNTALTVETGGRLNTNCQPITGPGTFTLQAGATLGICDAAGISLTGPTGAVQVTGARSFAADATYVYDGTGAQVTGNALPNPVRELEAANTNGVTLSQATATTHVLRLTAGTLNTGNQLTLLSTATRTAYAVHAGGLTSGNVTVQRYVGGPTAGGYRHLSSPVQAATVSDLTTTGFAPVVNPAYNALPYVALPAASFPTIYGFDETRGGTNPAYADFLTGYFSPATTAAVLTPGRGYTVFMPGAKTPDFVGTLTTGDVSMNLTVTGTNSSPNQQKAGWHLLGNLYPQPIDWDLASVPSGMSGSISVFRTQGGNNGQYLTRANGVGSLPNGVLPLGQGFFARATVDNTVFTFTNAMRVATNPGPVARPVLDARPVVRLTLQATTPNAVADETVIYAETGATRGEDNRFDGLRPGRNTGTVPTLASLIEGQEAAVNGLPLESLTTGTTVVELTAALPTAGTYTLTATDVANLPTGTTVSLLDRKLNITQPLTAGSAYQLTATTAGEVLAGRFALVFNAGRVLSAGGVVVTPRALQVYPNPASAQNGVQVTGAVVGTRLTLFDALGRAIAHATADTTGATTLPLRGLAAGVYTLRTPDGRTARLVVE